MNTPACLLLSLVAPLLLTPAPAATPGKPNVVLILIDDLSHYGVSAYGSTRLGFEGSTLDDVNLSTPNIDRLAAEGLRCDSAYAYPLCEPTRIALMSGKHNNRNLITKKAQHASDITFSDLFKRAGYATGIFGKWKQSRGTKEIPAKDYLYQFGWDEFCAFDLVKQGNRFFNPSLVINGQIKEFDDGIDPATGRRWFGPDICNRHALEFIEKHKDRPFFLYYPLALVHKEDEGNYHVPSPNTQPREVFDKFDDDFQSPIGNDKETLKYFPEMIRYTDTLIGRIIDKLDSLSLRENTLVVLMGDNATQKPFIHVLADGTRYPGNKGRTTDHGMHVPLIFSQPGTVPAGKPGSIRSYGGLVDLVDIHPTLCEAAGITPPNAGHLDGVSLWPQVLGKPGEHRSEIFTYYDETVGNPTPEQRKNAVILRFAFDHQYKRYAPHKGYPQGRFFDIRADSQETGGSRQVKAPNFGIIYHSGLDLDTLTPDQQAAFDRLGKVIEANRMVPVTALKIRETSLTLAKGDSRTISAGIIPAHATRNNVIWESGDPSIASIDKFGTVTARKPGETRISVYSWDDAHPVANNSSQTFSRTGISSTIPVTVR